MVESIGRMNPCFSLENFTLRPMQCVDSTIGKVTMLALSVIFGCATLGLVHLYYYLKRERLNQEAFVNPKAVAIAEEVLVAPQNTQETGKNSSEGIKSPLIESKKIESKKSVDSEKRTKEYTQTEIIRIANLMVNDLFSSLTSKQERGALERFSFSIYHQDHLPFTPTKMTPKGEFASKATAPLQVKFKENGEEHTIPLTTIIKAIPWDKLDSKWHRLNKEQKAFFCNDTSYVMKPSKGDYSFITDYSAHGYVAMNTLLRYGIVDLSDASDDKISNLTQVQLIEKIAKDRLFGCLCAAGALQTLPSIPTTIKLIRRITSSKMNSRSVIDLNSFLAKYKKGQIVTEESFLSTSMPGGTKYGGDIEYVIHPSSHSKGKSIVNFAGYETEKECLFPPFTSFKVLEDVEEVDGLQVIHLEELG